MGLYDKLKFKDILLILKRVMMTLDLSNGVPVLGNIMLHQFRSLTG